MTMPADVSLAPEYLHTDLPATAFDGHGKLQSQIAREMSQR
jgi:hypothetical protein